jgi:hypothetical protein
MTAQMGPMGLMKVCTGGSVNSQNHYSVSWKLIAGLLCSPHFFSIAILGALDSTINPIQEKLARLGAVGMK